jgi:hypothetical protein
MIRFWLVFVILTVVIHFGITTVREFDRKERWALTKSITYSILVALLAVLVMTVIVILF